MNKCDKIHLTEFDIATCGTSFQFIKAYLPYVDGSEQRMLAVFIRMAELMRTIDFYKDLPCPSPLSRSRHTPESIAAELGQYCSPKECEIFNLLSNFENINEMMKLYSAVSSAAQTDAPFSSPPPASPPPVFPSSSENAGAKTANDMLSRFLSPEQQKLYEQYMNMLG
ncbi:MAG: hypothetical protein NC223_08725 [Butyrivibrio sp.]|nr:hypothetical protein [Butyrivibrio sp.]